MGTLFVVVKMIGSPSKNEKPISLKIVLRVIMTIVPNWW